MEDEELLQYIENRHRTERGTRDHQFNGSGKPGRQDVYDVQSAAMAGSKSQRDQAYKGTRQLSIISEEKVLTAMCNTLCRAVNTTCQTSMTPEQLLWRPLRSQMVLHQEAATKEALWRVSRRRGRTSC